MNANYTTLVPLERAGVIGGVTQRFNIAVHNSLKYLASWMLLTLKELIFNILFGSYFWSDMFGTVRDK